jgi:hypothetical protein
MLDVSSTVNFFMSSASYRELVQLVCELSGPGTMRTFDNVRHFLEDANIKSTAQGSTPEEQASFNPAFVANALAAARIDNANTIVSWALEIQIALHNAGKRLNKIGQVEDYLDTEKDKLAYLQHDPEATTANIQQVEKEISRLELALRALLETPLAGHPSQKGSWAPPAGNGDVGGFVSGVSPEDT